MKRNGASPSSGVGIMSALKLHPRNHAFTWRPLSGPFCTLTAAQARQFDEQGWFVLENAFTAAEMDAVAAAIDPFEQKVEAFLREQKDGRFFIAKADAITFTTHLVGK